MIIYPYYVVYVEVPSGHPGVDAIDSPDNDKKRLYEALRKWPEFENKAILDIHRRNT